MAIAVDRSKADNVGAGCTWGYHHIPQPAGESVDQPAKTQKVKEVQGAGGRQDARLLLM